MKDEKQIRGRWWIDGSEKPPRPGVLDLGSGSLALSIWTPENESVDNTMLAFVREQSQEVPQVIAGVDEDNRSVTLFGCFLAGHGRSGGLRHWEIDSLAAIKGLKIDSWNQSIVRAVSIKPSFLNRWFGRKLLVPVESTKATHAFTTEAPMDLEFLLEDGIRIRFVDHVLPSFSLDEHRFAHGSRVWFQFRNPRSLAEITDRWVPWIIRLMGLLVGVPVTADEVEVFTTDPYEPNADIIDSEGLLIRRGGTKRKTKGDNDPHSASMVAPFNSVRNQLDKIVVEWNRVSTSLEPVIALFGAVALYHTLYLEARFLFLVQALEIYHACSGRFISTELPSEEHKKILAQAKSCLPPDLWKWAKGKLSFNARPLAQRLFDVVKAHEKESVRLLGDLDRAVSRISYTRNHLTHHHDEMNSDRLIPDAELGGTSSSLEALLWIILLREIGLDGSHVERVVSQAERARFINLPT